MAVRFELAPNAVEVTKRTAKPGLRPAASIIAQAAPNFVPVHYGTMRSLYSTSVVEAEDEVHVVLGSPFWHWLEYGTRNNPAYRPAESAVRSLGLRYQSQ